MAVKKHEANLERKPRDREQRWDEIIEAAAMVFYEKGYSGASLQDIASAVGLLKGSIYYYIETKEDLLFELVMRAQEAWRSVLLETPELESASAPTRLREFILRWMQLRERQREWGVVAEREFRRLSPAYLSKVIEGRNRFTAFVEGILRQGMESGDFDRSISLPTATNMVFELMHSAHLQRRPGTRLAIAEFADSYALLLIRGLGCADWVPPTRRPT
jgi:AcrR family transcriptional regulator